MYARSLKGVLRQWRVLSATKSLILHLCDCSKDINVVPILVGAISTSKETTFGKLLAPHLSDPENFFVVSSDFCHW